MAFDVLILGAGASGLMCAAALLEQRPGCALVLEKDDRPARKLMVTGNGRCNISNRTVAAADYTRSIEFMDRFFAALPPKDLHGLFERWGLWLSEGLDERLYPRSEAASSVLTLLLNRIAMTGGQVRREARVEAVEKQPTSFAVKLANGEVLQARQIVLAMGCASFSRLRPGNDGQEIARSLGHTLVPDHPALVPLTVAETWQKAASGVKFKGSLSLLDGSALLRATQGDVLLTDYGFSGTASMDLAVSLATAANPMLEVNFLPDITEKRMRTLLDNPPLPLLGPLLGLSFPRRLAGAFCRQLDKDEEACQVSALSASEKDKLCELLFRAHFQVTGTRGVNEAEVLTGGVVPSEIDPVTMESKLVPGCFILGDQLAGCGRCGGFNLHFAWTSGVLAAKALAARLSEGAGAKSPQTLAPGPN